jgi:hypothetical protein
MKEATRKIFAIFLSLALIAGAYAISWKIADSNPDIRIRIPVEAVVIQPTPTAQPVYIVNAVQIATEPAVYVEPTLDATAADFFRWQTEQADPARGMTGRIGEGTPTPAIGSRDMSGDTHTRSTAAP